MSKTCLECNNQFQQRIEESNRDFNSRRFCARSCATKSSNRSHPRRIVEGKCRTCQKPIHTKIWYCSSECRNKNRIVSKWLSGNDNGSQINGEIKLAIRLHMLSTNPSCMQCGWQGVNQHSGKSVLQIDHIDGNYANNAKENLRVLCPNCHSMTSTFGALNKGRGRKYRYK